MLYQPTLTERGQREVTASLRDALGRLKRRKAMLRERVADAERELLDLGAIEAALAAAIDSSVTAP